jgi:hypothetical protein
MLQLVASQIRKQLSGDGNSNASETVMVVGLVDFYSVLLEGFFFVSGLVERELS